MLVYVQYCTSNCSKNSRFNVEFITLLFCIFLKRLVIEFAKIKHIKLSIVFNEFHTFLDRNITIEFPIGGYLLFVDGNIILFLIMRIVIFPAYPHESFRDPFSARQNQDVDHHLKFGT